MVNRNIIEEIRSGDQKALSEVYKQYRKEFIQWAYKKYSCPIEEAQEIYQASFFIFYNNVMTGNLDNIVSNLKTYIFGIGKNKIFERHRRNAKYVFDVREEIFKIEEYSDNDLKSKEHQYSQISQALKILGDPCKQILEMVYYRNCSMGFITESLGYKNVDSTKNQKYKCMQRLKKIVERLIVKHES